MVTSLLSFYFFCSVILDFLPVEPVWSTFSDHLDYLAQSKLNLWSKDLYMPTPQLGFSPRPFTIPLFYKFAGPDPLDIVWMQKITYCLCIFVFVNAVLVIIRSTFVKIIYLPFAYYFFTWWVIVGFSGNLLSESLSMSLLFLWIALLILCIRYQNIYLLSLLILISTLFSFTRDTWPYIILPANLLLFLTFYGHNKILKKYFLILTFYSAGVLAFQSYTARVGERFVIPVYNTLATRIAANEAYLSWFKEKGMPCTDSIVRNFNQVDPDNIWSSIPLFNSYSSAYYAPLRKWIAEEGKDHYLWFMATHPSYFFLSDQTGTQTKRIFETTDHYYSPAVGHYLGVKKVFPLFTLSFLLAACLMLLISIFVTKLKNYWSLFLLFLIALFTLNVFLSYNADTFEVIRHLFITQVMIQLISILAATLLLDVFLQFLRQISKHKKQQKRSVVTPIKR